MTLLTAPSGVWSVASQTHTSILKGEIDLPTWGCIDGPFFSSFVALILSQMVGYSLLETEGLVPSDETYLPVKNMD